MMLSYIRLNYCFPGLSQNDIDNNILLLLKHTRREVDKLLLRFYRPRKPMQSSKSSTVDSNIAASNYLNKHTTNSHLCIFSPTNVVYYGEIITIDYAQQQSYHDRYLMHASNREEEAFQRVSLKADRMTAESGTLWTMIIAIAERTMETKQSDLTAQTA